MSSRPHRHPTALPDHPLRQEQSGVASGWTPSPGHLRQRSTGSPRTPTFRRTPGHEDEHRNPFDDAHASHNSRMPPIAEGSVNAMGLPAPTPHRAALMQSASQTSLGGDHEHMIGKEQAMAMRGDRAEWVPSQQFLHSSSSLGHDRAGLGVPGGISPSSSHSSLARYDISPDDYAFVTNTYPEPDDDFHDPGPKLKSFGPDHRLIEPKEYRRSQGIFGVGWIGILNLLAIMILALALVFVFAGWPIYNWATSLSLSNYGAAGLGGTNGSGQVPDLPNFRGLIDKDTPDSALTRKGHDGLDYQLVFSDEFNQDGRLFYEGMDPFWTAVDLHYWQTADEEWHDPGNLYTEGGNLVIELTKEDNASSHGFGYLGGMLQSWNQFCFVGGYVEVAASLPGDTKVSGLWPAAWMMSNLGRAGYGGSLDGTWPYVYDSCDVGTLPNQTDPATGLPDLPDSAGDQYHNWDLSWLAGQRFSRCACPEETDHPGPQYANGTWKGRGASEIDIFEATVDVGTELGHVSMSAQWAPFNPGYEILNSTNEYVEYFYPDTCPPNTYLGGATQQVTSGLCLTDETTYNSTTNMNTYGVEYAPSERNGWGTGYMTWTQGGEKMWTIHDKAMGPNEEAGVSERWVSAEPMYLIMNLAISPNFGVIDYENLSFPSKFRIDYVRVYQPNDHISVGCDPKENPTKDYIERNPELYRNPNLTSYHDIPRTFPKNRLTSTCASS
ncbi:hypothetical protein JCM10449v2_002866 [Rhodotorula kratochvilovae]